MSNGGSASYHDISVEFGMLQKEDVKLGSPLNSSIRNKIRKAWVGYNGRGQGVNTYQVNGKGNHFKMVVGGNQMVGQKNNISSQVLKVVQVDKNGVEVSK